MSLPTLPELSARVKADGNESVVELRWGILSICNIEDDSTIRYILHKAVLEIKERITTVTADNLPVNIEFRNAEEAQTWSKAIEKCIGWKLTDYYDVTFNREYQIRTGNVFKAKRQITGDAVALKKLCFVDEEITNRLQDVLSKVQITNSTKHPNILEILDVVIDEKAAYIVMPMMDGSVCSLVDKPTDEVYPNAVKVREAARDMLKAVQAFHHSRFVHGNIKPSNVMYTISEYGNLTFKIADFGGLFELDDEDRIIFNKSVAKEAQYYAPELFADSEESQNEEIKGKIDLFGIGCVLLELFAQTKIESIDMMNAVRAGFSKEYKEKLSRWEGGSRYAREFVLLLASDPERRPTAEQALADKWLGGWTSSTLSAVFEDH